MHPQDLLFIAVVALVWLCVGFSTLKHRKARIKKKRALQARIEARRIQRENREKASKYHQWPSEPIHRQ